MGVGRPGGLLFVADSISGRRFLCDTGAQVSALPAYAMGIRTQWQGPAFEAPNGSAIPIYGKRSVTVCFASQRFTWDFVLAKVSNPLLGADFLCAKGVLVDRNFFLQKRLAHCHVISVMRGVETVQRPRPLAPDYVFSHLLLEFSDITTPIFSSNSTKHFVEH